MNNFASNQCCLLPLWAFRLVSWGNPNLATSQAPSFNGGGRPGQGPASDSSPTRYRTQGPKKAHTWVWWRAETKFRPMRSHMMAEIIKGLIENRGFAITLTRYHRKFGGGRWGGKPLAPECSHCSLSLFVCLCLQISLKKGFRSPLPSKWGDLL